MGLTLVTDATQEPVSLIRAKTQVRLELLETPSDPQIITLIKRARKATERLTRRAWMTQTWKLTLTGFPGSRFGVDVPASSYSEYSTSDYRCIQIPRPPLVSVTSVAYVDADEASQTWASSNYLVRTNSAPGTVSLAATKSWPTTSVNDPESVTITYIAGNASITDVPPEAEQAILALVQYWWETPGVADVPQWIQDMLSGLHCGMKMGAYGVTA